MNKWRLHNFYFVCSQRPRLSVTPTKVAYKQDKSSKQIAGIQSLLYPLWNVIHHPLNVRLRVIMLLWNFHWQKKP